MGNSSTEFVIGMDLGEARHTVCVLNGDGAVVDGCTVMNNRSALAAYFRRFESPGRVTVAMEAGAHSPWISCLLKEAGFQVVVGNTRKVRAIWGADNKTDVRDAEMLARIARLDSKLLSPITHRNRVAQMDLAVVKSRDALVRSRSNLINFIRGILKTAGIVVPKCSAPAFAKVVLGMHLDDSLGQAVLPVLESIEMLTAKIRRLDRRIEEMCRQKYPETGRLQQVTGVGPVTALAFVLTLENPKRFRKSREVGPYLGLVPRRDQSGVCDKPLPITKAGNVYLRRLLVGCANYILGPFGPDCDLRRYGLRICARGGKIARRKAKVAVARKLAVLLHRLWESGAEYEPFRGKAKDHQAA